MDFSWSASHTILVLFIIAGFIGQVAVLFYRTGQLEKRQDKTDETIKEQGETFFHALERLEDRMDKRFVEVIGTMNQRLDETNKRIDDVRTETNQRLSYMQTETNQRLSDIEASIRQLNQNHIDHLTHHEG